MRTGEAGHPEIVILILICKRDSTESLPIEDLFSPVLHRIDSAIRHRAIHPRDPIPPPTGILTKFSHPPEELVENSKKYLDKLIAVSDVKKGLHRPNLSNPMLTRIQCLRKPKVTNVLAKQRSHFPVWMWTPFSTKRSAPRSRRRTRSLNSSRHSRRRRTSRQSRRPCSR